MIRIILVGCGKWGKNYIRNLLMHPDYQLVGLVDENKSLCEELRERHKGLPVYEDLDTVFQKKHCDALVIATPTPSHYTLTKNALDKGLHVLVEKPLASSLEEATDLLQRAQKKELTLMVDYPLLFSKSMEELKRYVDAGTLGTAKYYHSRQWNFGSIRSDANILWDLAPHELSNVSYLFQRKLLHVTVSAAKLGNPLQIDHCYTTLYFDKDFMMHFHVSWVMPEKKREVIIGGSKSIVVWEEHSEGKLKFYKIRGGEDFRGAYLDQAETPHLQNSEPLYAVLHHFSLVIHKKCKAKLNSNTELDIIRTLEAIDKELQTPHLNSRGIP